MNIKSEVKNADGTTLVTFEDGTTETRPAPVVTPPAAPEQTDAEKIKAAILAEIKPKLDAAYAERDEAKRKIAEFEKAAKEAHLKKLEDDGKAAEAAELRLKEAQEQIETLKKTNTELTRDVTVRAALKGFSCRNDVASEMAYGQILAQLTQGSDGSWLHKSGVPIADFVTQFAKDEANSFLFTPKSSSGGGTTQSGPIVPSSGGTKKLSEMTQAEVLQRAAKGEFGAIPQF